MKLYTSIKKYNINKKDDSKYLMEDVREASRLKKKSDPSFFTESYLKFILEDLIREKRKEKIFILDVGCGDGSISAYLAKNYPQIEVYALDVNRDRFKKEEEQCAILPNLKFHVQNALATSFSDNMFDVVFTRFLLEYIKTPEVVIQEMTRITRPGGVVLLQDLDGQLLTHYPISLSFLNRCNTVIKFLEKTGFDPFIGRKLFYLAKKSLLQNISVKLEPYHLFPGKIDRKNYELWETKLDIAMPHLIDVFKSEIEALRFKEEYLNYLLDENTLTFSTLFTVMGAK